MLNPLNLNIRLRNKTALALITIALLMFSVAVNVKSHCRLSRESNKEVEITGFNKVTK